MEESKKIDLKVRNLERKSLYSMIKEKFGEEFCDDYVLGLHGIYHQDRDGSIRDGIFDEGLKIKNGRTLLSTVAFAADHNDLSNNYSWTAFDTQEELLNGYSYGSDTHHYIIVALPKKIKKSNNEEIYLGRPNNAVTEITGETQGYQITSLSDSLLPDYSTSVLDSRFILGSFSDISVSDVGRSDSDKKIDVTFNPNHMSFDRNWKEGETELTFAEDGSIVDDEFFEEKRISLEKTLEVFGIPQLLSKDLSREQLHNIYSRMSKICRFYDDGTEFPDEGIDQDSMEFSEETLESIIPSIHPEIIIFETIRQLGQERYGEDFFLNESISLTDEMVKGSEVIEQANNIVFEKKKTVEKGNDSQEIDGLEEV